jgi:hypothetical protein
MGKKRPSKPAGLRTQFEPTQTTLQLQLDQIFHKMSQSDTPDAMSVFKALSAVSDLMSLYHQTATFSQQENFIMSQNKCRFCS